MRKISLILLVLLPFIGISQSQYSPETLQQFTNLYLDAKLIKNPPVVDMQQLLEKHSISVDRYRSILHLSLVDDLPELSPNELAFINEMKSVQQLEENARRTKLDQLCVSNNFDIIIYLELERLYKTDIKFQRSLQPYFNNSLSRQ